MATTFDAAPQGVSSRNMATMANWAGAAVSLALVVSVGVWGYELIQRDVSGIPVVEAAGGPMRVAPDDPGGRQADHQGLSVNNVAGTKTPEPPAERLVLAPSPADLRDEDRTLPDLAAERAAVLAEEQAAQRALDEAKAASNSLELLADQIALGVTPLLELPSAPEAAAETPVAESNDTPAAALADVAEPEVLAAVASVQTALKKKLVITEPDAKSTARNADGLTWSLRPVMRPAGLVKASLAAPAAPVAPVAASLDVDPASLAIGTSLVQLGAFDTAETARSEWVRISERFPAFFDGKQRVIQKANAGGRVFYRLRVLGFSQKADARHFCAELLAQQAECIPVAVR